MAFLLFEKKNEISILLQGRQKTDQNILVFGKSCFSGDKITYISIIWKNPFDFVLNERSGRCS